MVRYALAAFRFLTIFPLPGKLGTDGDDLKGALLFFPVVGVVLGAIAGVAAWLLWSWFPPMVAAVLLTTVLVSFSGALHLDGLADCADGFFSARNREKILEIMRDSRIGVMGAVALILLLLLKVSALTYLEMKDAVRAAFLMPIAGRSALVLMTFLLPYVRKEGGMGTMLYSQLNGWALFVTLLIFVGSFVVVTGYTGLSVVMIVLASVFIFSRMCLRKIGGTTGDTLGASCEIVETVTLVCLLLFFDL